MDSSASPKTSMKTSKAMAAVAFQDHLLHDLAIGELSLSGAFPSKRLSLTQRLKQQERQRKASLKNMKPTIDTGLRKKIQIKVKDKPKEGTEYVLDPAPKPLSLAQKMGLIPCDKDQKKLLTEPEWDKLKESSKNREDFKNPCVICKDDFRMEDQVLLSCSHVFHRACLHAFERFTGRKSCPMCRHTSYQTRVVHEGTRIFKHKSAARIQACWRGYVVRKWYVNLRKTIPPTNAKLRRKFYENKLSEITDRLLAMTSTDRIDRFLSNIDESLAHSRNIYKQFENNRLIQMTDEDWDKIEIRAVERGVTECPICLRNFTSTASFHREYPSYDDKESSKNKEPLALLSCSHVFHDACLSALEMFSLDYNPTPSYDVINATPNVPAPEFKCPVCRSFYLKRTKAV